MKPIHLRTARLEHGWTQVRLAAVANVPQNVISKLETTVPKRPTFETATRLAEALGVPIDRLRFGPDPHRRKGESTDGRRRIAGRPRRMRELQV